MGSLEALGDNLSEDEPSKIQAATPPKKTRTVSGPKTFKIMLEDSTDIPPTGLFLQLNGASYMLKAGIVAEVPPGILEILDHAVTTVPVLDPSTLKVIGSRDRLRFSYRRYDSMAAV